MSKSVIAFSSGGYVNLTAGIPVTIAFGTTDTDVQFFVLGVASLIKLLTASYFPISGQELGAGESLQFQLKLAPCGGTTFLETGVTCSLNPSNPTRTSKKKILTSKNDKVALQVIFISPDPTRVITVNMGSSLVIKVN